MHCSLHVQACMVSSSRYSRVQPHFLLSVPKSAQSRAGGLQQGTKPPAADLIAEAEEVFKFLHPLRTRVFSRLRQRSRTLTLKTKARTIYQNRALTSKLLSLRLESE